jgi:preprotein translocase subunit YajC
MFISPAYAQSATGGGDMLTGILPLILIFVVFWFLLIRPQQKRQKAYRELIANVKKGDHVVTNGGIVGKITAINGVSQLELQIEPDKIKLMVDRAFIAGLVNPDTGQMIQPGQATAQPGQPGQPANDGPKPAAGPLARLFGKR